MTYAAMVKLRAPDDTFLLVRSKRVPNAWMFPGGRSQPDDRGPAHTAQREIGEELSMYVEDFRILATCYVVGDFPHDAAMIFFHQVYVTQEEKDNALNGINLSELIAGEWVTADRAAELPMYPAMANYIARLREGTT